MKIYLAGPMTGISAFNFPAFHRAADILRSQGHTVINPAEMPEGMGLDQPWSFYMRRAIGLLLECDTICLLDGWMLSKGATLERDIAVALGMRRLLWVDDNFVDSSPVAMTR